MDLTAAPSRVLVVDDDETVSSLFARILSREGYTVETAANFESARQLLERHPPDVILLDRGRYLRCGDTAGPTNAPILRTMRFSCFGRKSNTA